MAATQGRAACPLVEKLLFDALVVAGAGNKTIAKFVRSALTSVMTRCATPRLLPELARAYGHTKSTSVHEVVFRGVNAVLACWPDDVMAGVDKDPSRELCALVMAGISSSAENCRRIGRVNFRLLKARYPRVGAAFELRYGATFPNSTWRLMASAEKAAEDERRCSDAGDGVAVSLAPGILPSLDEEGLGGPWAAAALAAAAGLETDLLGVGTVLHTTTSPGVRSVGGGAGGSPAQPHPRGRSPAAAAVATVAAPATAAGGAAAASSGIFGTPPARGRSPAVAAAVGAGAGAVAARPQPPPQPQPQPRVHFQAPSEGVQLRHGGGEGANGGALRHAPAPPPVVAPVRLAAPAAVPNEATHAPIGRATDVALELAAVPLSPPPPHRSDGDALVDGGDALALLGSRDGAYPPQPSSSSGLLPISSGSRESALVPFLPTSLALAAAPALPASPEPSTARSTVRSLTAGATTSLSTTAAGSLAAEDRNAVDGVAAAAIAAMSAAAAAAAAAAASANAGSASASASFSVAPTHAWLPAGRGKGGGGGGGGSSGVSPSPEFSTSRARRPYSSSSSESPPQSAAARSAASMSVALSSPPATARGTAAGVSAPTSGSPLLGTLPPLRPRWPLLRDVSKHRRVFDQDCLTLARSLMRDARDFDAAVDAYEWRATGMGVRLPVGRRLPPPPPLPAALVDGAALRYVDAALGCLAAWQAAKDYMAAHLVDVRTELRRGMSRASGGGSGGGSGSSSSPAPPRGRYAVASASADSAYAALATGRAPALRAPSPTLNDLSAGAAREEGGGREGGGGAGGLVTATSSSRRRLLLLQPRGGDSNAPATAVAALSSSVSASLKLAAAAPAAGDSDDSGGGGGGGMADPHDAADTAVLA